MICHRNIMGKLVKEIVYVNSVGTVVQPTTVAITPWPELECYLQ